MKGLAGVLPWLIVVGVAVGAIWLSYERGFAGGRWLLAGLLVAHGAIHVLFLVPAPAATAGGPAWPFDLAAAWPTSVAGLDPAIARAVAVGLIAAVIASFAAAGLSTVGIVIPVAWWPALAALAASLSLLLLALFFDPGLIVGMAIDLLLLWVALFTAWRPTPA